MVQIYAHRGSKGTHPENTLPAFSEAVRVGVDGIELDVHLSKDGQLIVIHDETVDRTTNGKGLVREKTLEELKKLNAGSWFSKDSPAAKIPALKEVLSLLLQKNYRGTLMIEIKTDKYEYEGIEAQVSELMTKNEWPFRHAYCSFNLRSLERLSVIEPDAQLDLLMSDSMKKLDLAKTLPFIEGLHPKATWAFAHPQEIQEFPKRIRLWTVNTTEELERGLKEPVDALITDFPERAWYVKQLMKK